MTTIRPGAGHLRVLLQPKQMSPQGCCAKVHAPRGIRQRGQAGSPIVEPPTIEARLGAHSGARASRSVLWVGPPGSPHTLTPSAVAPRAPLHFASRLED